MSDLSSLRLVTVPQTAPPYDCQVHGARCPAGQDVAPVVSVAPDPGRPEAGRPEGEDPAAAWLRRLAVVIVEVLAGVRPDRQLGPLATDRVRARVRNLAPLLAAERRPRIARIVTSRPADRVVEMTVVVRFGARSRALAMRFEHVAARPGAPGWPARPERWLCTALEAGLWVLAYGFGAVMLRSWPGGSRGGPFSLICLVVTACPAAGEPPNDIVATTRGSGRPRCHNDVVTAPAAPNPTSTLSSHEPHPYLTQRGGCAPLWGRALAVRRCCAGRRGSA